MKLFFQIFLRQFRAIIHDGGVVLFFLFLPLAYPVIYSLIYNPEVVRDVAMVVVDHDRSSMSREFIRRMDATEQTRIIGYAAGLSEGRRAMNEHRCYAIMEIPEGFERKIGRGESSPAIMYCEMSLLLRYRGFLVAATNVQQDLGAEIMAADISTMIPMGASYASGDLMPISSVQLGNIESGFDSFIMPGVVIFILHQCIILAVGMMGGAVRERPGLFSYNPLATRPPVVLSMLARLLCCLVILIVPTIFIIYYIPIMFRFPMAGSPLQIFAFLLPMIIACVMLGECLQSIVRQREDIFIIWVVTSVALLFLSGLTWPRFAMPSVWKALGDLIPATWAMEGFVRMNTDGASLSQNSTQYIMLWVLCGGYGVLAYIAQRFIVLPDVRRNFAARFLKGRARQKAIDAGAPTAPIDD